MPTIIDVAREAGVSSATVSRVLNDSHSVSPDTCQRVQAAIAKLDYTPNLGSRNLRRKESRVILVMIPDIGTFYGGILAGIDIRARQAGYNPLITATNRNPVHERELTRMLDQRQADGVISMTPTLPVREMIALNRRFPFIQCCEYSEESGLSHVSIDNYAANYQAACHLIHTGHKRIAMISSSNDYISTRLREKAYRQALEDHDIPFRPEYLRRGTYSFESGYEHAQVLINLEDRPTAILCICDSVAAGCISAAIHASLRVPRDLSVMGFDNIDIARMLQPSLSTIVQPLKRLGTTAVELFLERIGGSREPLEIFLPHELVIRNSTR